MREDDQLGFIKTGRIELGKTPSSVSGQPSVAVVDSEPVALGETATDPGLKKLGSLLSNCGL